VRLTDGVDKFEVKEVPKSSSITRDHVLDAMTYVGTDPSLWPFHSGLTHYVVIDPRNGAPLPPKLVLTAASQIAKSNRRQSVFSGGQYTNKRLKELGFLVLEKSPA